VVSERAIADGRTAADVAHALACPKSSGAIYPFGTFATRLVRKIGYAHTMDSLLTARMINANEVTRLNLASHVLLLGRSPRSGAWRRRARLGGVPRRRGDFSGKTAVELRPANRIRRHIGTATNAGKY